MGGGGYHVLAPCQAQAVEATGWDKNGRIESDHSRHSEGTRVGRKERKTGKEKLMERQCGIK